MDINSILPTKIRKQMVGALSDYKMIDDGDRVVVAVSGGKDSSILLVLLNEIRKRAKIRFDLEAVIVDQKQPGFDVSQFAGWVDDLGITLHILQEDTYSIVVEKVPEGKTYCSLCSRLRRGILYNFAHERKFNKIALGHHRDDIVETLFLNILYSGKIASMPPKLLADDERNVIIRPLCYVAESELIELAGQWCFPVIPCNLCGSQDGLKRQQMKRMLKQFQDDNSNIQNTALTAIKNIKPSQLMDHQLWDFSKF